jgi:hypothetical protein
MTGREANQATAPPGRMDYLFIWILQAAAGIELAMATLGTPASAPTLPEGIDVVPTVCPGWVQGCSCSQPPGGRTAYGVGVAPRHLWRRHFGGARDGSYYRFVTAPDTPGGGVQYRLDSRLGGSEDRL